MLLQQYPPCLTAPCLLCFVTSRPQDTLKGYKCVKFVPFNPNDKFTCATIVEESTGKTFRVLKGSPQV